MKLLKSALTDKDLCNVLIVMVLAMFPMFVRGPRSASFVHSMSMVNALAQECVQIAERAIILAIKAVTSSRTSKKHYYCLQQNIFALRMLKNLLSQQSYSAAVQDFHPKPISACNKGTLSTTGLERSQTVQSQTSRAASGGAPRASSCRAPRSSSGGAARASSGGAPRASSGGAPLAAFGGGPGASSGGAPRAFSCGALLAPSDEASRTSAGGAPSVPPAGTSSSSLEAPQTSEVP